MTITKKILAEKLLAYLNRRLSKEELIDWCERSFQEQTIEDPAVKQLVARLGLMDVKNFDLSYEELASLLEQLGFHVRVEIAS
jgi:hypothetical protein